MKKLNEPNASSSETNKRIFDFLKSHPVGVLATVDPNSNPHAAAVYYAVDKNFNVTFVTKKGTKKHDNLKHKNHVMMIAYEAETQTTAQITGVAEDISHSQKEANEAFRNMLDASMETSEAGLPPISKLEAGNYVAHKLTPRQIRMAVFLRPDKGGYDMYETIDFPKKA
ncbi:MAG: pyridoxamine 5'-phosphate oxidase family protein [Candidatus Saccharibacteria bacterium]|nr:pyridoxamine 5'-phosphate oxidase family protein [Candidatus Saccharibacteria bacterium]